MRLMQSHTISILLTELPTWLRKERESRKTQKVRVNERKWTMPDEGGIGPSKREEIQREGWESSAGLNSWYLSNGALSRRLPQKSDFSYSRPQSVLESPRFPLKVNRESTAFINSPLTAHTRGSFLPIEMRNWPRFIPYTHAAEPTNIVSVHRSFRALNCILFFVRECWKNRWCFGAEIIDPPHGSL